MDLFIGFFDNLEANGYILDIMMISILRGKLILLYIRLEKKQYI